MAEHLLGLSIANPASATADDVATEAQMAEEMGFAFVSIADHPFGSSPTNEAWTALTWAAASTTRMMIVSRVLGVPFRHPALVAKMAETLDRLSGGRLVLGLGAGGAEDKMHSIGLPASSPADRIGRLGEAVTAIQGLWSAPHFALEGRSLRLDAADLEPKPERRIPIWLGTFRDRGLALAGRCADGWIPYLRYARPEELGRMRDRVVSAAEAAGRRTTDVTCVLAVEICVGNVEDPPPNALTGSPSAIAERLSSWADLGFDGFNFSPIGPHRAEQPGLILHEVVPLIAPAASAVRP